MDFVRIQLLLSLALFTIPIAHASPSITSPQGPEATITIASEIFVVDPANIILDSTTIQPGAAGVSVDGQIVSADAANDLFVDGSEILPGPTGGLITSGTTTTPGSTNFGPSSSSSVLAGSSASISSTSNGTTVGSTVTPGTTSLGSSSLQQWSTGNTGSISNNTGYFTTNRAASAIMSTSSGSNSSATVPPISGPNSVPSQSRIAASAASSSSSSSSSLGITGTAGTSVSSAGSIANVSPGSSASQSESTASIPLSASSNSSRAISSPTLINNSTGLNTFSRASTRSQTVSFQSRKTGSGLANSATTSTSVLGPGTQPNTITTGPSLATPTVSWNPTGTAASSQGILLVGAIFSITNEAKTLSSILEDEGPKESFVSKLEDTDENIFELFEDINPPGPPPSYEDSCLDGASILNIFEDLGCLKSGFDEVINLLGAEPPNVPEIQTIFDNLGTLANNLKEEEDDDDDDDTTRTDENKQTTQNSVAKSSSNPPSSSISQSLLVSSESSRTSISVTSSISPSASLSSSASPRTTASSILSSSSALSSTLVAGLDTNPIFDFNSTDPDVDDQAALAFFGDLLSSAMGIGSGISGFATSTTANNATLTTSQPRPASSAATDRSSLATASTSRLAVASKESQTVTPVVSSEGPTATSERSPASEAATSRAASTSSPDRGNPTSSIISSAPITTTSPTPHTTDPPVSFHFNVLQCTQLEEFLQGGKDPYYIHTCTCNDGSQPTATISGDAYVCPSQVDVIIVGR